MTATEKNLDWVISGGESGAQAKPSRPQWFRDARDACQVAGTAFFFKQWGEYAPAPKTLIPIPDGLYPDSSRLVSNQWMHRVGKKAAGALLDGREYREMPKIGVEQSSFEALP